MKRCSQCGAIYDDNNDFCVVDGLSLNDGHQIVVSLEDEIATRVVQKVEAPLTATAATVVQPVFVYVLLGALGASVIFIAYTMFKAGNGTNSNVVVTATPSPTALSNNSTGGPTLANLSNNLPPPIIPSSSNKTVKTDEPIARKEQSNIDTRSPEVAVTKGYNGRVIMLNALVRIGPSDDTPAISVISYNQPVRIGKTAGPNSPWFRVTTANGTTGWMHGNTIEFVR